LIWKFYDDVERKEAPWKTFTGDNESLILNIMEKAEKRSFVKPDEVREFPYGKLELVNFPSATVGRVYFQPGWKWSTSVKPIAKTDSCKVAHFQYHISGVMRVRMDDGTEFEVKPGDVSIIPPGHDAWVVGNEPVVAVDFQGMKDYAKKH
jgi:mannose-6-phosphate isomerase-like protein (cupin superfamily)